MRGTISGVFDAEDQFHPARLRRVDPVLPGTDARHSPPRIRSQAERIGQPEHSGRRPAVTRSVGRPGGFIHSNASTKGLPVLAVGGTPSACPGGLHHVFAVAAPFLEVSIT